MAISGKQVVNTDVRTLECDAAKMAQAISRWIYTLTLAGTAAVAGIEFDSRHGDRLHMWALYERVGDPAKNDGSRGVHRRADD
jgi:hypothetical protein